MSQVEKLSVAVTPRMAERMRRAVSGGRYASTSELVREALRDWEEREESRAVATAELQRLWDEGLASGEPVDPQEALARIKAKIEAVGRQ